jgi:hypothetical protein
MASTCKQSFLKACEAIGLAFEKNLEIKDTAEFTDRHLETLINPPDVDHGYGDIKLARKPQSRGRK